jgi:hypothetical protein
MSVAPDGMTSIQNSQTGSQLRRDIWMRPQKPLRSA